MKNLNKVEVVLFSKRYFTTSSQKELLKWLGNLQHAIDRHDQKVKKLIPGILKNSPPIYLS